MVTPTRALMINGSVGWSKFWSPDIAARTVNKRQNNPFWTANAGVQYEPGAALVRHDHRVWTDLREQSDRRATSTKYNYLMPARSVFNSCVTYDNTNHDFSVSGGDEPVQQGLLRERVRLSGSRLPADGCPAGPAARVVREPEEAVLISDVRRSRWPPVSRYFKDPPTGPSKR